MREALLAGTPINKVLMAYGGEAGNLKEIFNLARDKNIPVQRVERRHLSKFAPEVAHQGVVALAAARAYLDLEDILESLPAGTDPFLLLLDEVNDPHNLGAILRTADAAGIHGVVIPRRRAAPLTPTVVKASAGAALFVPVARVTNIVSTIETLKKKGLWVAGADAAASDHVWDVNLSGPLALVIGGEDKGLGRLVKEHCDVLLSLPMAGRVGTLNASVAAALFTYEVVRQRRKALHERLSHR